MLCEVLAMYSPCSSMSGTDTSNMSLFLHGKLVPSSDG